jgi:hypothetical protein
VKFPLKAGLLVVTPEFDSAIPPSCASLQSAFRKDLTDAEIQLAEEKAQTRTVHGIASETERTYVEVVTVSELLTNRDIDYATLGMILQGIESG